MEAMALSKAVDDMSLLPDEWWMPRGNSETSNSTMADKNSPKAALNKEIKRVHVTYE